MINEKTVIGIIGAMDEEVTLLKEKASAVKTETVAGMDYYTGKLGDVSVVIVKCGIGKVNAGICTQILIYRYHASAVINTGVAGSLDSKIDIGDIVVSTEAVQHDFDCSPLGFAKGEIPYTGLAAFPADEALRECAEAAVRKTAPEIHVFEGRICSGDQFIASRGQKEAIVNSFGGLCCEMEGASVAQVCTLNHVPYVILRAISDKADDSEEMSYEEFKNDAAARCAKITHYMVTHYTDKK